MTKRSQLKLAIDKTGSGTITFKTRDDEVADAIEEKAKELNERYIWENETTLILIGQTKVFLLRARDHYIRALDLKPTHSVA